MDHDSTITAVPDVGTIIPFIRRRDFKLERVLGRGGCGSTVLLYDPVLDERFACKKFAPKQSEMREALFERFVREAKLMYSLQHPNVVRINFHFLYPKEQLGFIIMEYVEGNEIDRHIQQKPEHLSDLFRQTIEGFSYLETQRVMHRDIRTRNLLVTADGTLKIIDFGFGKETRLPEDAEDSIAISLWCDPPAERAAGVYDFSSPWLKWAFSEFQFTPRAELARIQKSTCQREVRSAGSWKSTTFSQWPSRSLTSRR